MNKPLNVLTIATGKKLYVDMAVNLARSFWMWNANSNIAFYLATDQVQFLPDDVKAYVKVITLVPREFGEGFSPKLHLDIIAPEGQTLFIDSDCLVYGDITPIFKKFKGHAVSVTGGYISTGEWFGDIGAICKKYGIKQMPKFNGGIYYIEKGEKADAVYQKARELETKYDEIGFVRLRNRPNDEVVISLAMAVSDQHPIPDEGSIMAEFINFQSGIKSDLLAGVAELYNKPGHPGYQKNWHLTLAKPLVVHFLGHHNQVLPYIKEIKLLEYISSNRLSPAMAKLAVFMQVTAPGTIISGLKEVFRPFYRSVFGTRRVKLSERVIIND